MKFFLNLFFLFIVVSAKTQPFPEIEFQTFTDKNGLSHPFCNKLTQDKNGLIWVGTKNGVSRYDGTRFKSFTGYLKGEQLVRLGNIYNLFPTESGGIWLGSPEELFYLNLPNESFYKLEKHGYVYGEKQKAMLRTSGNYYELPQKFRKEKIASTPLIKGKNDSKKYYGFVFDRKGNVWSHGDNYLVKLDRKTRTIVKKFVFKNEAEKGITQLYFDSKNRLWVSTWGNGVFLFNSKTEKLERVKTAFDDDFVALGFSHWTYKGRKYVVVLGDASLILVDEETLAFKMYEDVEGRFRIYDALQDKQGNLWLATEYGLKLVSSEQNFVRVFPIAPRNNSAKNFQKAVTSIEQSNESFFVSKRWFDGVYRFDKNWNFQQHILHFELVADESIKMNSSDVLGIQSDGSNTYFAGYYGLYKQNKSGKIKRIAPKGYDSYKTWYLEKFVVENQQTWWIKHQQGIFKFDPSRDEFTANYAVLSAKRDTLQVNSMLLTKTKKLLASTSQGLYYLNSTNGRFEHLKIKGLKDELIFDLGIDSRHHIWAMTTDGIVEIDLQKKQLNYKSVPQVAIEYGRKLCVDKHDNIWFHTNEGYCCYIQTEKQVAKFGYNLGLPDNRLEWFSMEMKNGKNGYVYAGAKDAVVRFNPDFIKNYHSKAAVLITDIVANDKRFNSTALSDGTENLVLSAGNYLFTLSFSVPDYTITGNYELYYDLVSDEEKWIKTKDGIITLNNLSNGKYVVRLKGKNNFTGRFTNVKVIQIEVKPFWWQTWWWYTLIFAISGFLIWGITRYFMIQRMKEQRFKRKIQESEMKTLRSQMNPHFMFNTINAINNFIVRNNKDEASDYLTLFSKLMRNILDNSKQEFITLEKELKTLEMYLKLEHLRLNQSFDYKIIISEAINEEHLFIPPLIIQPYCENAIWHGLRNKEEKGFLVIKIDEINENQYQIIIEDDGIGRIESAKLKQNENAHKSYGLQITEQRLQLINAENKVEIIDLYAENGLAQGTKIVITLINNE